MKKMMMIAAMMIAAISANAQNEVGQITLKPFVGMNLASVTKTDNSKMRVGLAAGVEAEYGVAENFGISAGVLYSMQGVKYDYVEDGYTIDCTAKLDYINIPILAQYYPVKGLAIKAGVQPAFNVSHKFKMEAAGESLEETLAGVKTFDLSIPVGLSYEYANFVLDARYNIGLTKVKNNGKNGVIQITLGYKFAL